MQSKDLQLEQFKHKIELNVRFMDLDALRHVNNGRYLNFLEEARIAYSQEHLDLFNSIEEFNVVVARIEIDYISPILFGEKVSVYTRISRMGSKSFNFESILTATDKSNKERIAAHANQTIVAFDPKINKSIVIPEEIKAEIRRIEGID